LQLKYEENSAIIIKLGLQAIIVNWWKYSTGNTW
jgi:hypothetical protein